MLSCSHTGQPYKHGENADDKEHVKKETGRSKAFDLAAKVEQRNIGTPASGFDSFCGSRKHPHFPVDAFDRELAPGRR